MALHGSPKDVVLKMGVKRIQYAPVHHSGTVMKIKSRWISHPNISRGIWGWSVQMYTIPKQTNQPCIRFFSSILSYQPSLLGEQDPYNKLRIFFPTSSSTFATSFCKCRKNDKPDNYKTEYAAVMLSLLCRPAIYVIPGPIIGFAVFLSSCSTRNSFIYLLRVAVQWCGNMVLLLSFSRWHL
jgi:hypothetical protein